MTGPEQEPPLVSVITIFLNEERFLMEAVESVFAQSYQSWELILVDDGSTDGSAEIARELARRHPERVRYVEHPQHANRGMSASRNAGLAHARGRYVTFLDADDVFLPEKLEQQVAILEARPQVAFVGGRAEWWFSWASGNGPAGEANEDFLQRHGVPLDTVVEPPQILIGSVHDEWTSLCDLMVRSDAVAAVGGYENAFRGMYEDQAFHAKLCSSYAGFLADRRWYRYRQHPDACTATAHRSGSTRAARRAYLEWLESYLASQGAGRGRVWRALKYRLLECRHPMLFRLLEGALGAGKAVGNRRRA